MRQLTCVAAVVAALSLAACGGGGGSSEPPKVEVSQVEPTEPTQAEKEAAEQVAREQAEREAREQEERERLAREEAEREEQERLAREEAERMAAEQERLERERQEREAARPPFPLPDVACDGFCQVTDGEFIADAHYGIYDRANAAADVQRPPVYFGGGYFRVGVDQGSDVGGLQIVGTRGDIEVRHGSVADGAGSSVLYRYLQEAAGQENHPRSPEVGMSESMTQQEREWVTAALGLVNASLPAGSKMRIFDPLLGSDGQPDIRVEFVSPGSLGRNAAGRTFNRTRRDAEGAITGTFSRVRLDRGANVFGGGDAGLQGGDRRAVILIAHEILHALGIGAHVSPDFDTLMAGNADMYHLRQQNQQPSSVLYPVDREALWFLYGGGSLDDFGPWATTSTHLHGNGPYAGFGVALRNGYAEPYAYGPWPGVGALADNRALSGTVTWEGALLGFSERRPVAGDARIAVNVAVLTGTADFTALESWIAGTALGGIGTGETWLDGDLGYSIAVSGNTFRETGGDTGTLTGIFTGRQHEGAAGTLERSDLTAAFGASR